LTIHPNSQLLRPYLPLAVAEVHAKETEMDHITKVQFFTGALILIGCIVLAFKAFLKYRRAKAAPFRDYFGPEYDSDLLEHSALSESEEWRADCYPRFAPFRLRNPRDKERR
jgi:hypothetical protein